MPMQTRRELKLTSLYTQLTFLEAARDRHKLWAGEIDDIEIEHLHLEIIGLLQQAREKYLTLLEKYYHIY